MLNKYPAWKNGLILLAIVLGMVYSAPNLFPDDPAVQVSHEDQEVSEADLGRMTMALQEVGLGYFNETLTDGTALVRFNTLDDQLRGKSI
ncbi:MAG: protein translocase subunit SecD, partial [Pseudomonadales bacterium]|nr:protein translocase subunit SecD [Pseudomonadales bacterium]